MPANNGGLRLPCGPPVAFSKSPGKIIPMSVRDTALRSVEEFLKLPDPPEGHIELHHGEVVVRPPPKGAPELVVEVLSPGNAMDEILERQGMCLANGCVSFGPSIPKDK